MDARLHLEVEVARTDSAPRVVALTAPAETSTGAALDVLGTQLGLAGAAGAVQARSLVCGAWLDRAVPLGEAGLLRGERLSLVVGLAPPEPPRPPTRWAGPHPGDREGRVAVNRPPRPVRAEPTLTVSLPTRRQTRPPRRFPLGAMLIPLLIGVLLVAVTRRWEIALFSLFTPVMVAWNHVEERRAHRDEVAEHGRTHEEEVALTLERIRTVAADWAAWLRHHHPGPDEVAATVRGLGPRLWERQPGDPDFLRVRLGSATRRAPLTLRQDESRPLSQQVDPTEYDAAAVVSEVPAVVDLARAGLLAVLGPDDDVERAGAAVVLQLAALHSPADLGIVAVVADPETAGCWRWLPHVPRDWATPAVTADPRQAARALAAVADLAAHRREQERHGRTDDAARVLVLIDGRLPLDPVLVAAVVDARDVGVSTVWLGSDRRAVPAGASHVLDLSAGADDAELTTHRGDGRLAVRADLLSRSAALDLAACLAPVRDASDADRARSVPDRVSLGDLVPDLVSPVAMRSRWQAARLDRLEAVLGVGAEGPVTLDLGPDGSHVLVGGTTGSGKSELLQSMVASVAASYPPGRVGFLLVDYKGGAAFKDAMRLPHCVGVVTDLDQHLTRRVMQALDAEIVRREELLAASGARDLSELRGSDPDAAPNDLVIVVDEFATLAKEIPEFVEGMVDLAARGRSLGLRLVLATQRPAGVVNDRIRANVGVRIALRVNDEADSNDVIGDPAAAHVARTLPGRAYLKVHRDLAEFQSAFVGAPAPTRTRAPIEVVELDHHDPAPALPRTGGPTVLDAVVDAANRVVRLGGWALPHVPWLPALPDTVTIAELERAVGTPARASVLLGLADLPERQTRRVVALDLARHQNLLVFGTSRSGKTTVLRTVAAGLVARSGPEEVHLYGMDFAGHGLHVLEGAPQCAGVVGPEDPGRVGRLLRRLSATVADRTRLMAAHGATDLDSLVAATAAPLPRVVVLLDGYAGAASVLERLDGGRLLERLERLVAEGPAVGVHFVITADRRAAIPSALASVVTTRLVLRMAERDDYALLGVDSGLARGAAPGPGRGFIQGATEIQVAVVASSRPDLEQEAVAGAVREAASRWPVGARPLGRMPVAVALGSLPPAPTSLVLPLGLGDEDVAPVALDATDGHWLVCGPPRSGKSTALATLATAAAGAASPPVLALFLARGSLLAGAAPWDVGPVDAADEIELKAAIARIEELGAGGRPVLCLCDDVDSLPDSSSVLLEALARLGRDRPVRVVAAADGRWALRAYGGLVPELRRSKNAVLLEPDLDLDGDLAGVRLRRPLEATTGPGRGFLVHAGRAELVQVAHLGDPGPHPSPPDPWRRNLEIRGANEAKGMP